MRELHFVQKVSPLTGKTNTMEIRYDEAGMLKWECGGIPIQRAMPYLTPSEREFLMTGYTPEDWAVIFQGSEE